MSWLGAFVEIKSGYLPRTIGQVIGKEHSFYVLDVPERGYKLEMREQEDLRMLVPGVTYQVCFSENYQKRLVHLFTKKEFLYWPVSFYKGFFQGGLACVALREQEMLRIFARLQERGYLTSYLKQEEL